MLLQRRTGIIFFRRLSLLLLLSIVSAALHADSPAIPRDYARLTEDARHVLIMLAGQPQQSALGEIYQSSGLYALGNSSTPLWTIDWYAFSAAPSEDGKHLVRLGPWASSTSQLAVAFYRNTECQTLRRNRL